MTILWKLKKKSPWCKIFWSKRRISGHHNSSDNPISTGNSFIFALPSTNVPGTSIHSDSRTSVTWKERIISSNVGWSNFFSRIDKWIPISICKVTKWSWFLSNISASKIGKTGDNFYWVLTSFRVCFIWYKGYIDVNDGCWRRNVLVYYLFTLPMLVSGTSVKKFPLTASNQHHDVTNIAVTQYKI